MADQDPADRPLPFPFGSPFKPFSHHLEPDAVLNKTGEQSARLHGIAAKRLSRLRESVEARARETVERLGEVAPRLAHPNVLQHYAEYAADVMQRQIIFLDTLRQRGNNFIEHIEKGQPPLLAFDYEVVIDGRELPRPANYSLVHILPGAEHAATRDDGRPYIIIDPRAGHGSGIGGFKDESEVGCALAEGHPVYFVIFTPYPVPDQTIGDVTAAEAAFVREVKRRHPDSPHPIVIGNCQGGWGAMLLAATNPDITGPVVANGTPLSYWAGEVGNSMMRYLGGVHGAMLPIMMLSDLGGGTFDGANLVYNFESLNPGNTWWTKYYSTFANGDDEAPRYLEFERWWSGFYFMSEPEIRWILENLFVGNKLARGQAFLDERTHVDLRDIRSPIIIFCSHGDNITPPQQALYWIPDNYVSVDEIRARGQRILYTLHPDIGHLGIFVSSKVAAKQHKEIVSTLKTIESLAPGLYEMVIAATEGEGLEKQFTVAFEARNIDDIVALGDGHRTDERAFASVSRTELLSAELYDIFFRPILKSVITPQFAKAMVDQHPLRQRRYFFSDQNPMFAALPAIADRVREDRRPAAADNPFLEMEKLAAGSIEHGWNMLRDLRNLWTEAAFFALYDHPMSHAYGEPHAKKISDAPAEDLTSLPEVQRVLDQIDKGGFGEALIRMLVILAHEHGSVRRDRLEKSNRMLLDMEPFAGMRPKKRTRMIHEQSIAATFAPDDAIAALPTMLADPADRARALEICAEIAGPADEMSPKVVAMFARLADVLGTPNPAAAPEKAAPRRRKRVTPAAGSETPDDGAAEAAVE